ncbi:hypothetical protein GCM10023195_84810 [Actinoallomurus liliacearum]|uniref:AMP-dependent synthetase/ligase domain-containing protein n=1 Tax=Actinoallomurus liliacearum TaxID=1080073 RepID=A0ABP8TXE3_9ACTN
MYGSSPAAPARLRQALERLGPGLMQTYATTEAPAIATLQPAYHAAALAGRPEVLASVGRPMPGVTVTLRRTDGTTAPPGEIGEVCVQGPGVLTEYWNRPDDAGRTVLPDGRLRTGDLGRFDPPDRRRRTGHDHRSRRATAHPTRQARQADPPHPGHLDAPTVDDRPELTAADGPRNGLSSGAAGADICGSVCSVCFRFSPNVVVRIVTETSPDGTLP